MAKRSNFAGTVEKPVITEVKTVVFTGHVKYNALAMVSKH
jgi:hypothetical protein